MTQKRLFFLDLLIFSCGFALAQDDYYSAYENLQPADFEYIYGIDPYQAEDYKTYMVSPYPLLRTGVDFRFKNIVIPEGYYLLTPREKGGRDYVLFKQNGRVSYIIPVWKKQPVTKAFYKQNVPVVKKTLWQKVCKKSSDAVGRISKDSKRKALPDAYIDVNEIGQDFYEVVLYYGAWEYHLIFKKS